jgi:hypothetical protein
LRQPGLGNGPVPLGESVEAYEIDVIVAGDVVRTITSSTPSISLHGGHAGGRRRHR